MVYNLFWSVDHGFLLDHMGPPCTVCIIKPVIISIKTWMYGMFYLMTMYLPIVTELCEQRRTEVLGLFRFGVFLDFYF